METAVNIITTILSVVLLLSSLTLCIGGMIAIVKDFKRSEEHRKNTDKLIDKKCKEIENSIGKELAQALDDNKRLKALCDRTLAAAEKTEEELAKLRSAKAELKKENRELREKLLEKSEPTKIEVK